MPFGRGSRGHRLVCSLVDMSLVGLKRPSISFLEALFSKGRWKCGRHHVASDSLAAFHVHKAPEFETLFVAMLLQR